jgi:hypothetical protein
MVKLLRQTHAARSRSLNDEIHPASASASLGRSRIGTPTSSAK